MYYKYKATVASTSITCTYVKGQKLENGNISKLPQNSFHKSTMRSGNSFLGGFLIHFLSTVDGLPRTRALSGRRNSGGS